LARLGPQQELTTIADDDHPGIDLVSLQAFCSVDLTHADTLGEQEPDVITLHLAHADLPSEQEPNVTIPDPALNENAQPMLDTQAVCSQHG